MRNKTGLNRYLRRPSGAVYMVTALATLAALFGCASDSVTGRATLVSLGTSALEFDREFSSAAYAVRESEDSFFFADVSLSDLLSHQADRPLRNAVFVHVQVIWKPKPGMTPVDATATNAVTRILIVSEGEVGLYGGAAFARLDGEPGEPEVELEIEGGTLTLLERTTGFNDLLSPSWIRSESACAACSRRDGSLATRTLPIRNQCIRKVNVGRRPRVHRHARFACETHDDAALIASSSACSSASETPRRSACA